MAVIPSYFRVAFDSVADPAAIVRAPGARFTVLTSRLLRLEYDATETFEDRPSQTFWYRRLPVPSFTVKRLSDGVEIETEHLYLCYHTPPSDFTPESLTIKVKETGAVWHYGDTDPENLLGTARTLDQVNGRTRLEPGLLSRSGWAIVDDSASLVFNEQCWLENRPSAGVDLYFFGYGHHYQDCLRDYCKVAGPVPMIPRWILGNWWSRYWEYSQDELMQLMENFERHEIPLAVCVVDMDWHITKTGNRCTGWTGFTWNKELFPDPKGFIAWLHRKGLRTALNLHPAEGVHPHEAQYTVMARALGIDPATQTPVPFDITNPAFVHAYFTILLHPMEEDGVDFWWMDWQQGRVTRLPGLDPLYWLNHLHFLDHGRDGRRRPFIFSRWAGLANHRYPIGFSGDTVVSWESLAFQPYFTATAANVNFGWWSHDIGGHMRGIEDPELYTRWVQFGLFSPILRLHSTKNPYHDRRPWAHGPEVLSVVREAMQLRHAFIPYIYSMAWRYHKESIPPIVPMYHVHPQAQEAYHCPGQYYFGSELIVAPFVQKRNPDTGMSRQVVWLPEGVWFSFFDGEHIPGGCWRAVYGQLQDIPVFAKAGAIVPLGPRVGWGGLTNPEELHIYVFPGADNTFILYEDDGETTDYTRGVYCTTCMSQEWQNTHLTFTIYPAQGDTSLIPKQRRYLVFVRGVRQAENVRIDINGVSRPCATTYDEATETLLCESFSLSPIDKATLTLETQNPTLLSCRDRRLETCRRLLRSFHLESRAKAGIDADLPSIMADVNRLAQYWIELKDAQTIALVEVIRKHALDHT